MCAILEIVSTTGQVPLSVVEEYQRKADEAERSPLPLVLKIVRAVVWLVYAWVLITTVILFLAFILRLLGASTDASFTQWVYRSAESAMRPFRGIFPAQQLGDNSVLDTSLLFAIIVYLLIAILVHAILQWLGARLAKQEWKISSARADADALANRYAAERAAASAAAAQQYEVARVAAQQALAAHDSRNAPPVPPAAPPPGTST